MALGLAGAIGRAEIVDVTSVKFANVRAPNGSPGTWLEATIALNVKPPSGSPGQMLGRVKVSFLVGVELPAVGNAERRTEHYRADAECVALDAGRTDVRFYLPPELVKRDQLHGDPKFWGIELTAGGKSLVASKSAYSTSLAGAELRKSFQVRATAGATVNDGVMLPQYLTPFANDYPRATPSFVRREGR
jgi:hypothetical protein